MKTFCIATSVAALSVVISAWSFPSRVCTAADAPAVGISKRVPWTTSRIKGSPEPPLPYVTVRVFPELKFNRCLNITALPGSDRLFVVEQGGKIFSFVNEPDVKSADLVIDLAKEITDFRNVYSLTFHPDFKQNRYCYVCYIAKANTEHGSHIARFRVAETDPPTIDASSETTILTWWSGGHNGCCLRFGPDGYLYISTGDGTPPNPPDSKQAGQDVSNLLSCILRIDVNHADGGRNYRIPADNPFVDLKDARGEIWAYGFRNPWRMSFDRKTGDLWVGDVGWELWEMLNNVQRGGNYGWGVMEGRQSTNPEWPRGPTPILPPTIDHPHSESSSITDGFTYYGSRLQELQGTHIYSDYDTGKFWGFRYRDGKVVNHRELADTTHRVVGMGEDQHGEMLILDHIGGSIHRLVANPQENTQSDFPRKLSESGLFTSVAKQQPAPGVVPYSINAEPWADNAFAERFVAIPGELSITFGEKAWEFPQDMVLVKTLSLEMEKGNLKSRRHMETQILHFDGIDWQPYTYRWNEEQTDAVLLGASGAEHVFDVTDTDAAGGKRRQIWRFSGRGECQRCHNKWSGPPLAFNTPQLNTVHNYGGLKAGQLDTLAHIRILAKPVPTAERPQLADPHDESADLTQRVRAYLHVNCAHCHRLHAGSSVLSKMQYDLPLEETDMLGVRPTQGTFGIHSAQVIAPGDPFGSVLFYRMSKLGGGRMPHIGSTEVDRAGVALIYKWIESLTRDKTKPIAGGDVAAKLRRQEREGLGQLKKGIAEAARTEIVDGLFTTTSGALMLLKAIDDKQLPDDVVTLAIERGTAHQGVAIRDLFERFLPPEKRVQRLGSIVQPDSILKLAGDAARGKQLFFNTAGVQCKNCHRIQKEGKEVGPDLTAIGKKYNRAQLLESILEPSKRIDPKYVTYLAETTEGRLLTGLLIKKDAASVTLKDAKNKLIQIPTKKIEQFVPQRKSVMPELLLRDLTAQQVADLLDYLATLK